MTKHECEMKIARLMIEAIKTYKNYDPTGEYLSLCFCEDSLMMGNKISLFATKGLPDILAWEINELVYSYDTYEYKDQIEDKEENEKEIQRDIEKGNIDYLLDYMDNIIEDENAEKEDREKAEELKVKLEFNKI